MVSRMLLLALLVPFCFSLIPVFTSSKFSTQHIPPNGMHVECPERVGKSIEHLKTLNDLDSELKAIQTRAEQAEEIIGQVHSEDYIEEVKFAVNNGRKQISVFDGDTYIDRTSYDTCVLAQQCWMDCVDSVLGNKADDEAERPPFAFALSRPPGHHAPKSSSMGFCIFNYAMGAVKYAQVKYGIEKVSILDFDVHYGNGVASIVEMMPNIRYSSLHQLDIFPGSGKEAHVGPKKNIKNIGIPAASTKNTYMSEIPNALSFLIDPDSGHIPELFILSAGYDALDADPMASVSLQANDYFDISKLIKAKVEKHNIPILGGLEGGYDLTQLPLAIESTLRAFSE
jgi:acetoin utilization deacetylase AcuC-like enzyme